MWKGGENMRSKWLPDDKVKLILAALTPENALACEVSLRYGLRIGDVLSLKTEDVRKGRFTITEEKTGKRRRLTIANEMQGRLLRYAGRVYVFPHRTDWTRHRTRQAVYKDIRRAAAAFRLGRGISPHSMRKVFAVDAYKRYGSIARVQRLLQHSDEAVTMIYAMADKM
jgi:integrase